MFWFLLIAVEHNVTKHFYDGLKENLKTEKHF